MPVPRMHEQMHRWAGCHDEKRQKLENVWPMTRVDEERQNCCASDAGRVDPPRPPTGCR